MFRLFFDETILDLEANRGFESGKAVYLLGRLRDEKGVDFEVIDTSNMSEADREAVYAEAVRPAVWKHYSVRKVFGTNRNSGCFFGRGVPALLVREGIHTEDVYPHEEDGTIVTITDFLESLLEDQPAGAALARDMDAARAALGPIGVSTSELIREGRHR